MDTTTTTHHAQTASTPSRHRARWAAIGAAVAVSLGAGGLGIANAADPATPASFVSITPCRVADTRSGIGPQNGALGADATLTVPITGDHGQCKGIPADATGVALNVTTTDATATSYLTVWPSGKALPNTSNLNYTAGSSATPNAVLSDLSDDGKVNVYNFAGSVNVIADVTGFFVPATAGATGPAGPAGPHGPAAWDLIPAGTTVTGVAFWDTHSNGSLQQHGYTVTLPGRAAAALTNGTVNYKAGDPLVDDGDATCTGTAANPTAPPGKVCLYDSVNSGVVDLQGAAPSFQKDRAFVVRWLSAPVFPTNMMVEVVWAYTQPG